MQIDPKISYWLNVALGILVAVSLGTISFSDFLDPVTAKKVASACAVAAFILNMVLHGYSAPSEGPGMPPVAPKVVIFLALAIGALALAGGDARAQARRAAPAAPLASPPIFCDPLKLIPGCTEQETKDSDNLSPAVVWKRIQAVALPDLVYAKALADSAAISNPAGGGGGRSQCLSAIIDLNKQTSGANVPKNPDGSAVPLPDPHVISGAEMAAEIIDELGPNAPVMQRCAAAANAAKMNALAMVNAIVTGAVSFAGIGAGIP